MFTGLISDIGTLVALQPGDTLTRMRIECSYDLATIGMGASIACSGPCLTAVAMGPTNRGSWFEVEAAAETLARTTVGQWKQGRRINLERSLKIGDELGGHIVTGHIDATATIVSRREIDSTAEFRIEVPAHLARFIAEKGSVALDGTSLTVNDVAGDVFSVLLIPHTLAVTTWGERRVGDSLNLEVDLMARYAARLVESRAEGARAA